MKDRFPRATVKALVSSLNKLASQGKTAASKKIRQEINIKAGDLGKQISINKATQSRQASELVGKGKRGIPLILFGGKWIRPQKGKGGRLSGSQSGASYMVRRGQRKIRPHSFIAVMKSGHKGIFVREGKKRIPIKEQFGIQPSLLLRTPKIVRVIKDLIRDKAGAIFKHEFIHFRSK